MPGEGSRVLPGCVRPSWAGRGGENLGVSPASPLAPVVEVCVPDPLTPISGKFFLWNTPIGRGAGALLIRRSVRGPPYSGGIPHRKGPPMIPNFVKPSCPTCGGDIDRWHSVPKNLLDDVLALYPCEHVFEGEEARNVHHYISLN